MLVPISSLRLLSLPENTRPSLRSALSSSESRSRNLKMVQSQGRSISGAERLSATSMKSQFVLIVVFTCINCCWGAQKFSAAGMVLQVDSFHHTIRVSCQPIPGYMGAGRLRASVRDAKELVGL